MTESEAHRTPNVWVLALALFVVACCVGLASQLTSRKPRPVASPPAKEEPVARSEALEEESTPAQPSSGGQTRVDALPEPVFRVPPEYPDLAREANIEGTVVVQVLVGTDGRVQGNRVLKSIPELDDAAIASVEQWKFRPAIKDGRRVAVWVAVPVRFSLQ